jgi:hypothetical protein
MGGEDPNIIRPEWAMGREDPNILRPEWAIASR